ncbi:MAG: DUF4886 domain-containing protein [Clostridia bacterium]|nr:DUF4886 domain-containing protein [Clostridia bacterium]
MKTQFRLFALFLLLATLLTSCGGPSLASTEPEATKTEEAATKETKPAPVEIKKEQPDPTADRYLNVLVIGNSFSTGWPDELNGLFTAAGIKVNIFTVYYSGCPVSAHWNWLKSGQKHYRLRHHEQDGGISDDDPVNLEYCLKKKNWDVISLQQHFGPNIAVDYDKALKSCEPFVKDLYDYIKENYPKSKLVWHQTWAYEVGWKRDDQSVPDLACQTLCHENIRAVSIKMAQDNGVALIPSGDAFAIARANGSGDLSRDGYHDGKITGGQYLNACTWFESLTGMSCLDNSFRPKYKNEQTGEIEAISEERIKLLQNAAHEAVANNTLKPEIQLPQH